jgi:hypothetical protein
MKKLSNLRVIQVVAWLGVALSLNILISSYFHYRATITSLDIVITLTPLERDIQTEIVSPLVVGRTDADLILKLVHNPYVESHMLHKALLNSVEQHQRESLFAVYLWSGVLLFFLVIAIFEARCRREP